MGRKALVSDEDLMDRLGDVFRDAGYEGASMAELAAAAGLKKASLYHRFPGGKRQMADEALRSIVERIQTGMLAALQSDAPPRERLTAMTRALDWFYDGGRKACLLNTLASPDWEGGPFNPEIGAAFEALTGAVAGTLVDAGLDAATARRRALKAVSLIEGALVVSRGRTSVEPFQVMLADLPEDLLTGAGQV